MKLFRFFLVLVAGVFSVSPARAADRHDIYGEFTAGMRFQQTRESKPQAGLVVGFLPVDSIGVGFGFDRTFTVGESKDDAAVDVTQYYVESRWFLEPWEFSAAFGWQELEASNGVYAKTSVVALGTVNYLLALTSRLAAKIEFRGQYVVNERSYVFAGLGSRFIF